MGRFEYDQAAWEAEIDSRVRRFNTTRHSFGPGGACPICHGCGLIFLKVYELGSHYVRTAVCSCVELERQKDRLLRCGMPELVRKHSFADFTVKAPWQQELLDAMKEAVKKDNWVMLCGQSGCGKTHLAAALCRELICGGKAVYCISWPETARKLAALSQDYVNRELLLNRLRDAQVLLIDDLFKSRTQVDGLPEVGKSEMDSAFELLDYRYRNEKRTILTTELRPSQLRSLNEALYGRIRERSGPYLKTIVSARDRNWRTGIPS